MKSIRNIVLALGLLALSIPAFAQTFELDPVHTHADFRVKRAGVSYLLGRFDEMTGSLSYDADNVANSSIEFLILAESINTGLDTEENEFDAGRRDGHLRSPDFFDAAQFPTLSFSSTSVSDAGDNMLEVTGDLTIHGVTNEVTVMVEMTGTGEDQQGNSLIGFFSEFSINRSDYGMTNLTQVAADEVFITIALLGKG